MLSVERDHDFQSDYLDSIPLTCTFETPCMYMCVSITIRAIRCHLASIPSVERDHEFQSDCADFISLICTFQTICMHMCVSLMIRAIRCPSYIHAICRTLSRLSKWKRSNHLHEIVLRNPTDNLDVISQAAKNQNILKITNPQYNIVFT